ncbi:MAG: lysophospholipid acyltransferase family protein [Thermomicrobiales bacterium]
MTAPTQLYLYWTVRFASTLLSVIPVRLSYALAGAMGEAYCIVRPSHSRWAAYNLARVLNEPETSRYVRKVARQSFGNYARVLVDFLRLPAAAHAEISASASVTGVEQLARAAAQGKGFILVTGHMGSWDRAGAVFTGYGYKVTVLVDTFSPPQLDAWVTRMRRKFKMSAVAVERPSALREMYRVLQRGEALVALIDTPDPDGVPVAFFGERAMFPAGIARLALRTGCPVIVAGLFRRPDMLTYDGFCELATLGTADPEPPRDAEALTQRIATALERAIVAHPAQWYMFRPMWTEGVRGSRLGVDTSLNSEP